MFLFLAAIANAQDIPSGLSYQKIEKADTILHVLTVDPTKRTLNLVHGLGQTVGRETLSHLVRRVGSLAAINGSFFQAGGHREGEECYLVFHNGRFQKLHGGSVSVFGRIKDAYHTDVVEVTAKIHVNGKDIPLHQINTGDDSPIILYTDTYHRSTLTHPGRKEVSLCPGGQILSIANGGTTPIPQKSSVLSFTQKAWEQYGHLFSINASVGVNYTVHSHRGLDWLKSDFMLSGIPTLLSGGKIKPILNCQSKDFVEGLHARTAVGITHEGKVLLVVAEGVRAENMTFQEIITYLKEQGYTSEKIAALTVKEARAILKKRSPFQGVSLKRLTTLLQELGAKDALNLDGGTSSGMCFSSACSNICSRSCSSVCSNSDPLIADALVVG